MRARAFQWTMLAAVPALLWAAACGDDTNPTTTTASTTTTTTTTSGPGGSGASGGMGGVGGAGGGTGGSISVESSDACPPTMTPLAAGGTLKGVGTTKGAVDDYTTFCGDADPAMDTPDVVYGITVDKPGTLELILDDAAGFDGVLSLRHAECAQRVANDECVNTATDGETYKTDVAAGDHFIVVDGVGKTSGDFTLTMKLTEPKCGDGVVNKSVGEECDVADDTCYPAGDPNECTKTPPPLADLETCPGYDVVIDSGQSLTLGEFSTSTYNDDHIGTCALGDMGGLDNVFHFHPSATGKLTLTIGNHPNTGGPWCDMCGANCMDGDGCWIPVLYVRGTSCDQATGVELGCAFDPTFMKTTATVTVDVVANLDYWVFVDSNSAGPFSAGPYYLEAALAP